MRPQSSQIFFHFFARFHLQFAPISRTFMTNFLRICLMGEIFIIYFDLVILELHCKLLHGTNLPYHDVCHTETRVYFQPVLFYY